MEIYSWFTGRGRLRTENRFLGERRLLSSRYEHKYPILDVLSVEHARRVRGLGRVG